VFMRNQPVAIHFAVAIGDLHNQLDRLALRISPADMLDGVALAEGAGGLDVQVSDPELHRHL
jgi:hypothetical protein